MVEKIDRECKRREVKSEARGDVKCHRAYVRCLSQMSDVSSFRHCEEHSDVAIPC